MKTITKFMTGTLAAVMLTGCAGSAGNNTDSTADTTADTTAVVEVEEAPALLVTPDLTYAEVKGNVKTVKSDDGVLQFDEAGNLVSGLQNLKRDKDGLISKWGYDEYTLTWADGLPSSLKTRESDGGEILVKYSYDNEGRLVNTVSHANYPGDEEWDGNCTFIYTDDSFDEHGNWVKRKLASAGMEPYTQTREITYYGE